MDIQANAIPRYVVLRSKRHVHLNNSNLHISLRPWGPLTSSCHLASSSSPVQYAGLQLSTASRCRSRQFSFVLACSFPRLHLRLMALSFPVSIFCQFPSLQLCYQYFVIRYTNLLSDPDFFLLFDPADSEHTAPHQNTSNLFPSVFHSPVF